MKSYFPKFTLPTVQTSNFNLHTVRQLPASVGPLYPVYTRRYVPHDTFKITPTIELRSNPLLVDLMGTFKVSIETFVEPLENLYGAFDNNVVVSNNGGIVSFPLWRYAWDDEHAQDANNFMTSVLWVGSCSLMNMLHAPYNAFCLQDPGLVAPNWAGLRPASINLETAWAYLDIVRTHYCVNTFASIPFVDYGGDFSVNKVSVSEANDFFMALRANKYGETLGGARTSAQAADTWENHFGSSFGTIKTWYSRFVGMPVSGGGYLQQSPNQALFCRPYGRDLFTNVMSGSASGVVVSAQNGQVTYQDIITASSAQASRNILQVVGNKLWEYVSSVFNTKKSPRADKPILVDAQHFYVDINTVKTTAASGDQPAGSSIGSILQSHVFKPFYIKSDGSYGHIISIVSITPVVTYGTGWMFDVQDSEFADIYNPLFDNIPFQPVPRYYFDTNCYGAPEEMTAVEFDLIATGYPYYDALDNLRIIRAVRSATTITATMRSVRTAVTPPAGPVPTRSARSVRMAIVRVATAGSVRSGALQPAVRNPPAVKNEPGNSMTARA